MYKTGLTFNDHKISCAGRITPTMDCGACSECFDCPCSSGDGTDCNCNCN